VTDDEFFGDLRWFLVFYAVADAYLFEFDADGWRMCFRQPAYSSVAILPPAGGAPATLADARWLADACAFDHDAPVGVAPAWDGDRPRDPAARAPVEPVVPLPSHMAHWYWDTLGQAYSAIVDNRFNDSQVLRYNEEEPGPSTDFSTRFAAREERVSLYAMATRQADVLSEYLCLYRVLETVYGDNGRRFSTEQLARLRDYDFGTLRVVANRTQNLADCPNVFEVYRVRALHALDQYELPDEAVAKRLCDVRNALAHGKHHALTNPHGQGFDEAVASLPIVKLLARIAVEDPTG
jgi:hypothetical protein